MADKLDWLNEHFVLFKHQNVIDVVTHENYKIPFEQLELAQKFTQAEDYIFALGKAKLFKQACEFLSYNIHNRALVWWAYCCVLSLKKELLLKPGEERDISDIGKPKPFSIPKWAIPSEEELADAPLEFKELFDNKINELKQQIERAQKLIPPQLLDSYEEIKGVLYGQIKQEIGYTPEELLVLAKESLEKNQKMPTIDMENSPIFKAEKELKSKIEKIRQDTVETIKNAVPQKPKPQQKQEAFNAINATYSYIVAPNDLNAKKCLDLGNMCPDVPEGLLSLVAFWSYGNMMPGTDNVIKTPPGLASNGFNSLLNMLALQKGGVRKYQERIELYFNIGKQIGEGLNNWSSFLTQKKAPHQELELDGGFWGLLTDEDKNARGNNSTQVQVANSSTNGTQNKDFSFKRFVVDDK